MFKIPYISKRLRKTPVNYVDGSLDFDIAIKQLGNVIGFNTNDLDLDGVVNFVISVLLYNAYNLQTPDYKKLLRAIGTLEMIKQELYRRLAAPHEDKKLAENGDVFN